MQKVIVIRHSDEDNQNSKVVGKKEHIDWDKFK